MLIELNHILKLLLILLLLANICKALLKLRIEDSSSTGPDISRGGIIRIELITSRMLVIT